MLIGLALLLFIPAVQAQDLSDVTLNGQIRQRSQLDKKSFDADASAFDFHELRTRLNVGFEPTDRIKTFVQVQDTRNFGDGSSTLSPPDGTFDLHQAYFKVNELFDAPLSVKVGRQKLVYGTQRLIGGVEWSNQARTFDGGVLAYEGETASVDLFAARLPQRLSATGEGSDNLLGLYSTWALAGQTLDVFAILDNNTRDVGDETQLTRFTPGVTLMGSPAQFSYRLEGAYQAGNQAGASIGAFMLSAFAKYTFDTSSSPSFGAGYTRLSGDDDPSDDDIKTFDTLFATNHKFYGFMDYFLAIPSNTNDAGLQDFHVKTSVDVSESVSLGAKVHHFMQAAAPGDTEAFGQEVDLTLGYQFADPASVTIGASSFFPGDAFAPDGDTAFWGYVMTSVSF